MVELRCIEPTESLEKNETYILDQAWKKSGLFKSTCKIEEADLVTIHGSCNAEISASRFEVVE